VARRQQLGAQRRHGRVEPANAAFACVAADRSAAWSCCRTVTPRSAFPLRDPAPRQSTRLLAAAARRGFPAIAPAAMIARDEDPMSKAVIGTLLPFLLSAAAANAQESPAKRAPRNWETAADGSVTVRGRVVFTDLKHEERGKVRGHAKAFLWFP